MTEDEIIDIAHEAGSLTMIEYGVTSAKAEWLVRFAKLVAEREREACAKVCDEKVDAEYATGKVDHNEIGWTQSCAAAIRARSEK